MLKAVENPLQFSFITGETLNEIIMRGLLKSGAGDVNWTNHGNKHTPPQNVSWKDITNPQRVALQNITLMSILNPLKGMYGITVRQLQMVKRGR